MKTTGIFTPGHRDHDADGGGQRVRGRDAGDAEDRAPEEPYRILGETLVDQIRLGPVPRVVMQAVHALRTDGTPAGIGAHPSKPW